MQHIEPAVVQSLLQAYIDALEASGLRHYLHGVYLYGSATLGAFDERTSDIDVIALTQGDLGPAELDTLETLHKHLAQEHVLGARLDAMYVPLRDIGKRNAEVAPYPYTADGEFHRSGHFDLNGVTWWLVKQHGITLFGPKPQELPFAAPWEEVLVDMEYNLNTYWAGNYAGLLAKSDIILGDYFVLFTVSTLCRILSTVEDGGIPTKLQALLVWRDRLPRRYHHVVDETLRIRQHSDDPSLYSSPIELREDMLAFMKYAIGRGNRALMV